MDDKTLHSLIEDSRFLSVRLDLMNQLVNKLKLSSYLQLKINEHLKILLNNCSAEIIVLNDFLFSLQECNSEDDIKFLIDDLDEEE